MYERWCSFAVPALEGEGTSTDVNANVQPLRRLPDLRYALVAGRFVDVAANRVRRPRKIGRRDLSVAIALLDRTSRWSGSVAHAFLRC